MAIVVQVHLHTVLQYRAPQGRITWLKMRLHEGATVSDILDQLKIEMEPDALILVINHRVVDEKASLVDGDRLDVIPAISGG